MARALPGRDVHAHDLRKWRTLEPQPFEKDADFAAFGLDQDTVGGVRNEAVHFQLPGEVIDERPEADALHYAFNGDSETFHVRSHAFYYTPLQLQGFAAGCGIRTA